MKIEHHGDYRKQRAAAYPSVEDQLDAIWKWINAFGAHPSPEAAAMLDRVKAVKMRFPKQ